MKEELLPKCRLIGEAKAKHPGLFFLARDSSRLLANASCPNIFYLSSHHTIFLYIFSFHTQTYNVQLVLEQQIKYLQSKSRTTILLPCNDLLTSIGYKERMTPIQQLLKLIEKFSAYSSSDRIFSQFRYAFSYNLSASRHLHKNQLSFINIFGELHCSIYFVFERRSRLKNITKYIAAKTKK